MKEDAESIAETFGLGANFLHGWPAAWPSETFWRQALGSCFYAIMAEMCTHSERINDFQFAGNTLHKLEA